MRFVAFHAPFVATHCGVDLIPEALPFGRLWYGELDAVANTIDYAKFFNRSHDAVIRVYDAAGTVIETHEHGGDFKGGQRSRLGFRAEQKAAADERFSPAVDQIP